MVIEARAMKTKEAASRKRSSSVRKPTLANMGGSSQRRQGVAGGGQSRVQRTSTDGEIHQEGGNCNPGPGFATKHEKGRYPDAGWRGQWCTFCPMTANCNENTAARK